MLAGDRDCPLDGAGMAADNGLARRVIVRKIADLVVVEPGARRLERHHPGCFGIKPDQSGHRTLADRNSPLHRLSAQFQ